MTRALRIVLINLAYDPAIPDAGTLLDRYDTLSGWCAAVARAGASVRAIVRFSAEESMVRDGVRYDFVSDNGPPMPPAAWVPKRIASALAFEEIDVVHINGLMFPAATAAVRAGARPDVAIVVQDHGGYAPSFSGPLRSIRLWQFVDGFATVTAGSFTAAEQAAPWQAAGVLTGARILEIVEASTTFEPRPKAAARRATDISGTPAVLWVGRLDDNKDPLTALAGLERALPQWPEGRCWMIYGDPSPLALTVRKQVAASSVLRDRVSLVGAVWHEHMPDYFSAADLYLSASHREGSGYALIEAMACGVTPVVTDIPPFRAIAGECGARWRPGDADDCARALLAAAKLPHGAARERFERALTWDAIAARTVHEYRRLVESVRGRV